jgi:hypothetical protein
VGLAQKAIKLSPIPDYLDTLAAAYAELGKFEDAIATQEKIIAISKKEGKAKELVDELVEHLKHYRARKPWREKMKAGKM